jgi:transposase
MTVAPGLACRELGKDNDRAIRLVCSRFIVLCRTMGLFAEAGVAIDGSASVPLLPPAILL